MAYYLLDSNVLSPLLRRQKGDKRIEARLKSALLENAQILISPVVYYEVAGLLYQRNAQKQLSFLEQLVAKFEWRDMNKGTWDIGARLWADCRERGTPTGEGIDKDVLIAAQAKEHDAVVVTNNTKHFKYLGVNYERW